MRKAFDANVPKLRPRLKANGAGDLPFSPPAAAGEGEGVEVATQTPTATPTPTATATPGVPDLGPRASGYGVPARSAGDSPEVRGPTPDAPSPTSTPTTPTPTSTSTSTPTATTAPPARSSRPSPPAAGEGPGAPAAAERGQVASSRSDVLDRKERLEKIKRKVAEAARPTVRPGPAPTDPARAAESVLGLVRDLEEELVSARDREDALRADLDEARKELSRTAADGRAAAERLAAAEGELEEKRSVLAELLEEMQALEDERDESVRRAQALSSLDEERARLLEEVTRRAEEEASARAEREAEVERLSEELRAGAQDGARLRAALGELARERDQLAAEVDRARAERDDLAAAKRALEQVHEALAQARARLG